MSELTTLTRRRFAIRWAAVAGCFVAASLFGDWEFAAAADPEPLRVRLVIDYNDGSERHFTAIPWKKEMTVLDVMEYAKRHPRGIDFRYTGSGGSAFLTQIDDLKNEGGGRGKKNWIMHVNQKPATQGFGVFQPKPKDVITWRFEEFKL